MTMKTNRMRSIATFAPMMMLAAAACTAEVDESQGFEDELVGTDEQALITDGQVCINVQRGASGAVEDATLWQSAPTWNDGASARISAGTSESGGYSRSLVRFDLSAVPAGATVVSADLSLMQVYKNGPSAAIDVLRATAPWAEGTVTWNSFGGAFDPSPVGSFTAVGDGGEGLRTIDVRALAQDWVSGAAPNHGVVIDGPTDTTRSELRSSDSPNTGERPALSLCYTTCDDGVQNGEETGVDCGGPSCISCLTCYDGVQNGQETGVDCGGPSCSACHVSETFYYSAGYTNSATQNTSDRSISLPGGATVVISTCGYFWGDTFLRLTTASGTLVALNDDSCGWGSQITYQVPANAGGTYVIRGGCFNTGICGGTVSYYTY
jgi:hypothetical protein